MQPTKPYLNNLTALRGIAALLVVVYHCNEGIAEFMGTSHTFWFKNLYLMVDLFFILSGFIMCYVYEKYFLDTTQKNKIATFLKARLARIYPLHIITLAVCVVFAVITLQLGKREFTGPVGMAVLDFKAIPSHLFLLQSAHIHKIFTWNVPSWSISAEWFAYLLFPFLVKPFSKFNFTKIFITVSAILILYAVLIFYVAPNRANLFPFFVNKKDLNLNYDWGFARGILGFVLGMCMYRLYVGNFLKKIISSGWFFATIVLLYGIYMHLDFNDIAAPILFSLLLLSTAYGNSNLNSLFSNKILQKLGLWSFSIYMWHGVIQGLIYSIQAWVLEAAPLPGPPPPPNYMGITNPYIIMVLFTTASIFVGALSYHFIENPSRVFINNWRKREKDLQQSR